MKYIATIDVFCLINAGENNWIPYIMPKGSVFQIQGFTSGQALLKHKGSHLKTRIELLRGKYRNYAEYLDAMN